MTEQLSPERAKELSSGLYGELSAKYLSNYVVPFFFGSVAGQGPTYLNNGSAYFIKTDKAVFGITAAHVVNECLQLAKDDHFSCGLFPVNFTEHPEDLICFDDLASRIIDKNDKRDIATFGITEAELNTLKVSTTSVWPPKSAEIEKGVGFCGYPGIARNIKEDVIKVSIPKQREIIISFMVFPVLAIASSITEYQITYVFDWEKTVQTQGFRIPPGDFDIGGMSGGPALIRLETPEGIEHWGPGGVISEGKMNPELGEGRIIAARIDECLGPQGHISKT